MPNLIDNLVRTTEQEIAEIKANRDLYLMNRDDLDAKIKACDEEEKAARKVLQDLRKRQPKKANSIKPAEPEPAEPVHSKYDSTNGVSADQYAEAFRLLTDENGSFIVSDVLELMGDSVSRDSVRAAMKRNANIAEVGEVASKLGGRPAKMYKYEPAEPSI